MKKILALVLALAMVATFFGCAAEEATTPPEQSTTTEKAPEQPATDDTQAEATTEEAATYTIALLLPLSGGYANVGKIMDASARVAYEYFLNEVGGFQSKNVNVEFLTIDHEGNGDVAAAKFEQNVSFFDACIGCYNIAATIICGTLGTKYGKIFINAQTCSDSTVSEESDYAFMVCLGETESITATADGLWFLSTKDVEPYDEIAVIHTNDEYCTSLKNCYAMIAENFGWEVSVVEALQSQNTTDASAAINKVKNSTADLLCTPLGAAEALLVQKQLREYKVNIPVYGGGAGYMDPAFFQNVDGAGDYVVSGAAWLYDVIAVTDPALKALEYADVIKEKSGLDLVESGAFTWQAVGALLQAVEDSPSLESADVAATLKNISLPEGHWACLMTQFPGVEFGDVEGSVGVPMRYNIITKGGFVFGQAQNDYWHFVFSNATGEPDPQPLVWPPVPFAE